MPLDLPPWAPTVQSVAAHILARTRLPNGQLAGTFTSETVPTAEQANEVIQKAVNLLRPRLGPVSDAMADQAQEVCSLRAAFMLERAFFLEQIETSMSPYASLRGDYKDALCDWDMAAKGEEPNSETKIHAIRIGTDYPSYATGTY